MTNSFKEKGRKSMSLSRTLTIAFLLLSVVVLVITGVIQIFSYSQTQRESFSEKLSLIGRNAAETVSNYIAEKFSLIDQAGEFSFLQGNTNDKRQQIFNTLIGMQPAIRHLVLINPEGRPLFTVSRLSKTAASQYTNKIGSETTVLKSIDRYISPVEIDPNTNEPMITIAVTKKNAYGNILGTIIAEINLKFMWDLMDSIKVGSSGYTYVVDDHGRLIAFRDAARVLKAENITGLKPVNDFLQKKTASKNGAAFDYKGILGTETVGLYIPLKTPAWAVVTEMPIDEATKELSKDLIMLVINVLVLSILAGLTGLFLARRITVPLVNLTKTAVKIAEGDTKLEARAQGTSEVSGLAQAFNSMTGQLRNKAEGFRKTNEILSEVIAKAKEIIVSLNSASKEIEAATQEQTSGANEHASGITEVSATLQQLSITAKQITKNVGELMFSSEEGIRLLKESENQLLLTVTQLDDVGRISKTNAGNIVELGKRSAIINEMVELIKGVANKTNILSINASIEASRSGESGAGFSVVAAEIRELSRETIESAKKAEVAAREIKAFLDSIVVSSENEASKVIGSGKTVKNIFDNMESIVSRINNNYSFTQKIDVSIRQQESGSIQAAETMKQMAEIARQSAEIARQTLSATKDIVAFGTELDRTVAKFDQDPAAGGA
jgi:methyl-accepting chemotaxis protein